MSVYLGASFVMCITIAGVFVAREIFSDRQSASGARLTAPSDNDRLDLSQVDGPELTRAACKMNVRTGAVVKRTLDVLFSIVLLIGLAPMLILTALAIKLDSSGPILYRQQRVGKDSKVFAVYKFRSMFANAEQYGPQYASVGDTRITPVGHIIRRLRIDEIPQTVNVLKGEMSFVGPRPERPEFVSTLEAEIPHYHKRHLVKPGITGWAQVRYEYAASVEGAREKLRYDLFYISTYSPLLDLAIIAMTVRVALFGVGSR